jgi:hypothetical protein
MTNNTLAQVYDQSMAGIRAAMAEEQNNFQRAVLTGDLDEQVRASQAVAGFRTLAQGYHEMAVEHAQSMNAPPVPGGDDLSRKDADLARRYGLTANELGVAKGWTSDQTITDEDKVRTYLHQRQRYRQARADGSYRDDQGQVRR